MLKLIRYLPQFESLSRKTVHSQIAIFFSLTKIHATIDRQIGVFKNVFLIQQRIHLTLARHAISPSQNAHGGGVATPHAISPLIEIELWKKTHESLKCSKSNGTRVDLFRSYLDPSRLGQSKKDAFEDVPFFFANNFRTKKYTGII